jgi:hypothetical protein
MSDTDEPRRVKLGRGRGPADPDEEARLNKLAETQLERVRKAAEGWRNGLAGLLGLIAIVSVVKGRDTITELPHATQVAVGVLLAAALLAASTGAFFALRAAYGPLTTHEFGPGERVLNYQYDLSVDAVRDIKWKAVPLTILTVLLLTVAITLTWYTPEDPPAFVLVTKSDGTTVCGELTASGEYGLTITEANEMTSTVALSEFASLEVVDNCST